VWSDRGGDDRSSLVVSGRHFASYYCIIISYHAHYMVYVQFIIFGCEEISSMHFSEYSVGSSVGAILTDTRSVYLRTD